MKQILLLLLLLFPCFAMAQYTGNANQKITLGEQTTADGLVYRGVENDTALITPRSDTSAYIILDTVNNKFYNYNRTTNVWSLAGGGGGGTAVTSVATGLGLSGGPITSTGTILVDTASASIISRQRATNTFLTPTGSAANLTSFPTLNQNTTGSAATLTTGRTVQTNLATTSAATFNGSVNITPGVTGVLPVANGGTGATTAANARTSLGGTTSGISLFTLTNSVSDKFIKVNANNTITLLSAADTRTAIGAGTGSGNGTVTSVSAAATAGNPLSITNNTTTPVIELLSATGARNGYLTSTDFTTFNNKFAFSDTTSLNLTSRFATKQNTLTLTTTGTSGAATLTGATLNIPQYTGGGGGLGTVTSVAMTVPSFLSIAGSPITTSGTLAVGLSGNALPVANGGTGASVRTFVDTFSNQTINGAKTFNNRLISTNAMHFVDTALSIVSFAKKTVQPNGMVGTGSGVLSAKTDFATGTGTFSVTVDPTGRFVYVANASDADVSMFVINQTNGTLSAKTDFTTGTQPFSVTVDPTGRFVYVANFGSNNVSMYVINQTNGTLSAKTDFTTGTKPRSVAVDPTGRFVYVANDGSNTVSMFVINQTNGTLSAKTDFTTGTQPFFVAVDPTGRFVYVANDGSNTVSMFVINQTNGTLSAKQDFTAGTRPFSVAVDPTGRFVYVANFSDANVSMYVINQTNGTLSAKQDFTAGTGSYSVNVDPTGRFVYVTNLSSNNVSMFVINQTNGTLSTKTDFATNTGPRSVAVDPTGRFVYVANTSSNNVSQYFIQGFSVGGAYIAGRLSVGVDSSQTNYRVNIGTTFKQDSLFVGGRVTAVGYTTRSDIDAKENIMPINYGINEVMELEPVSYNYLKEEGKSLGFIAQDIGLIIPEAISWETPFSVYYQYLIPILTKAIQQQQTLIKSLQNRLLILENK